MKRQQQDKSLELSAHCGQLALAGMTGSFGPAFASRAQQMSMFGTGAATGLGSSFGYPSTTNASPYYNSYYNAYNSAYNWGIF